MNQTNENPYETPSSDIITNNPALSMQGFTRFSAWGVFGLSIITLGIYPIYWMYTRARVVNNIHENTISDALLYSIIVITILSFGIAFFEETDIIIMINGIITLIYVVLTITLIFKIRNRLQDIMNGGNLSYYLSPVLTFFFTSLYLQYKINQYFDDHA